VTKYNQQNSLKKTASCVLLLALLLITSSLFAQVQTTDDLMDLSLDELLNMDLTKLTHHTHSKGEWMVSYRFMRMGMEGNRLATDRISQDAVLQDFMVSPIDMTMDMHMIGLMYGHTDRVTLMAMVPYNRISMNHVTRMGMKFTTNSEGIGDIKLTGLVTIFNSLSHRVIFNGGISFPTGSITPKDDTPMGPNQKLPYPMRLGSGTFDPIFGLTYLGVKNNWSWGFNVKSLFRVKENNSDYALGDQHGLSTWFSRRLNDWFTVTLLLDGNRSGNIDGKDPDLNPMMVPTAPNKT